MLSLLAVALLAPQTPEPFTITIPKALVEIKMVPIPGGTVTVGGKPVQVKPFFMATTELTWDAFDAYLLSGPASVPYDQTEFGPDAIARPSKSYVLPDRGWGRRGYPAISLNYDTALMAARWLGKETGRKVRLPNEAEWELAARAGVSGAWKHDAATIDKFAWHAGNAGATTHPVGKKEPNAFGLFDTLGNVGEWATDMKGDPLLMGSSFMDPAAKATPLERKYWAPAWQESDPQIPKSRWWLSDGPFAGMRIIIEG